MRIVSIIAAFAGLAVIGVLVGHFGVEAVIRSLRAIGWSGFLVICLIHLAVIAVEGVAWRLLVTETPLWIFLLGRLIRDAGSEVLPFSQMGGCVLGARVVALAGVRGTIAAASTMADLTLEFFAKLVTWLLGSVCLSIFAPINPLLCRS